jgi:hypothetical protein
VINSTLTSTSRAETNQINYYKEQAVTLIVLTHYDLLRLFGPQNINGGGLAAKGIADVKEFKNVNIAPAINSIT